MPGGGGRGAAGGGGRGAGAAATPGARGGPGGTPAFPRPAGAPRNQASMPAVPLSREPALGEIAREDRGELGQRATALLARVTWPGKVNTGPAVVPLTPDEQQRFAAGREVYQTLCAACHQAGRTGPRPGRAKPRRLRAGGRPRRHRGPHRAQRQGRVDRTDAAARRRPDRRSDRRGADLHPPRMGPHRIACRPFDGHRGPRALEWTDPAVDGRGARALQAILNAEVNSDLPTSTQVEVGKQQWFDIRFSIQHSALSIQHYCVPARAGVTPRL